MFGDVQLSYAGDTFVPSTWALNVVRGSKFHIYGMASYEAEVYGFPSNVFDNSSSVVGTFRSDIVTKMVKSNAPLGNFVLYARHKGESGYRKQITIRVLDSLPTPTPDPTALEQYETIPTSLTNLVPNSVTVIDRLPIKMDPLTMMHVYSDDKDVRFSVEVDPHDFHASNYNWPVRQEQFVEFPGQDSYKLSIYLLAPSSPHETKTVKLYIGSLVRTVRMTTGEEPLPASYKSFSMGHTSGSISLRDVQSFFGGGNNLLDYKRGYRNIPNIPENNKIDRSAPLTLTDYRGAVTALYVSRHPYDASDKIDTKDGGATVGATWQIWTDGLNHWDLGFSPFIKDNAEFYYTYSLNLISGYGNSRPRAIRLWSPSGSAGAWSLNNRQVNLQVDVSSRSEFRAVITVNMYARHKNHTTSVVSTSARYTLDVVGP